MSHSVAIVQARMGSTRLPGKVLLELGGRSVLAHVLARCAAVPGIDAVCCATTEAAEDDAVAAEAAACGAFVYRGTTENVLARYARAAEQTGARVVLRVTSDCPLVDPEVCGAVLRLRAAHGADYAANNMPRSFPHGLDCEAFTSFALARAEAQARTPFEREHVTPWLRRAPMLSRANLEGPGGALAAARWTLDYPEDYAFLEALFAHMPRGGEPPDMEAIVRVLDAHPELEALNAGRRTAAAAVDYGPLAVSEPYVAARAPERGKRTTAAGDGR